MSRLAILIVTSAIACSALGDVTGPSCGLAWDRVDDPRVTGYRLYVDGEPGGETAQGTYTITCEDAGITPGVHQVYATAFSVDQESAPSNTIEVNYDPSELVPPNLKIKLTIEWSND